MRIKEVRSRLNHWQRRLNITHWKIDVKWIPKGESDDMGDSWWHFEEASAGIRLAKGAREDTLLHELLHIVIDGHTNCDLYVPEPNHERAINDIARALIEVDY